VYYCMLCLGGGTSLLF
nr:immunoglobulin light chain junction region [Macaca mulatta]MOX79393.1 immunoglobulin light chain junction region [Macaca mulatta]